MIIGHKKQIEKLKRLYQRQVVPHAFLFSGPDEVGKRTVALWFLKTVNCEKKNDFPCEKCSSCDEINNSTHCDVLEIKPEMEKKVGTEYIELVRQRVSCKPLKASYKGIVIDKAHLMNSYAQNALLKTLEEPTGSTVIFLITAYPYTLKETLLSRLFQIKFSLVAENDISDIIKDGEVAGLSVGRPGRAVVYKKDPREKEKQKNIKELAENITVMELAKGFAEIKKMTKDDEGADVDSFLSYLLKSTQEKLRERVERGESVEDLCKIAKNIQEVIFLRAKTNISLQLALEKIIVN